MKTVLLTGGGGFFGTRFRTTFRHSFNIVSTDVAELDILDREKVADAFNLIKPDYVIHAAAIALTGFCNENPDKCREINVTGALNVGQAAKEHGARMIFLSSEQVFNGNGEAGPYSETDTPAPDTVYGKNKLEAEGLLAELLDELVVLRFCWMFGVPERGLPVVNNLLWDAVRSILSGKPVKASPNEYRGVTYVNDVVDRFDRIMDLDPGIYHVGSFTEKSRYDLARHILVEMGLEARIDELLIRDDEAYREHPRDARLDTGKIGRAGIPFTESSEAISRCIREYSLKV